jgi:small subunit ribosomal protein S16
MLTIRLTRKGKKNQPFFRVVLVDKRSSSKSGKAIEDLGYKNPLTKKVSLKKERILYWISKGAKASETIHNLLVSEKIIEGKKMHVSKLSKKAKTKIAETAKAKTDAEAAEKAKAEAEAKAKREAEESAKPAESPADNQAGESADPKPTEVPAEEKPAEESKEETPAT